MSSPDQSSVQSWNCFHSFCVKSLIVSEIKVAMLSGHLGWSRLDYIPNNKFSKIFFLSSLSGKGISTHCLNLLTKAASKCLGQLVHATTKVPIERFWASLSICPRSLPEASLLSLDLDLKGGTNVQCNIMYNITHCPTESISSKISSERGVFLSVANKSFT